MNDATPLVVANHKSNLNWQELENWLESLQENFAIFKGTLVICPASAFLESTAQRIKELALPVKLGAQDISKFEQGKYTGELAASQIADICHFAIIGHSERRSNFNETDDDLKRKVENATKVKIEPIFCVQAETDEIPQGVTIVAYEPVFAIGTGNPEAPQKASEVAGKIKQKGSYTVLYGGSVNGQNVKSYIATGNLDGVLVGSTNSLDPVKFREVVISLN